MDNHVNISWDVENENFSRVPCDIGSPDEALQNPWIGHRQAHTEPTNYKGAGNEEFPIESQSATQKMTLSMYNSNNFLLSFHNCTRNEADIEKTYVENIRMRQQPSEKAFQTIGPDNKNDYASLQYGALETAPDNNLLTSIGMKHLLPTQMIGLFNWNRSYKDASKLEKSIWTQCLSQNPAPGFCHLNCYMRNSFLCVYQMVALQERIAKIAETNDDSDYIERTVLLTCCACIC